MTAATQPDSLFETYPTLRAVHRFAHLVARLSWFHDIGDPMDAVLRERALDYAAALGFPDVTPAVLVRWEDAAAALETRDYDSPAWEAEEQLRMALTAEALTAIPEAALRPALESVEAIAAEAADAGARDIARFLQIGDPDFVRIATGAAVQACHQAALLLAVQDGAADHPFALKLRLFEHGRWPLGIVGMSLNIF